MFSSGPRHCLQTAGQTDGLLPRVGVGRDGPPVRGVGGARRALLQLLQRPAGLQRQVVQERQGVLQVNPQPSSNKTGDVLSSYLPGKVSPITIHNLPGIKVELSKSSMNYVTLSPLSLDTTGRYRCEVSEEVE